MLPDLHVAPHWPPMQPRAPITTHQEALRVLHEIRRMICAYRREEVRDWRYAHAQGDCIVNVVAGLIADARAIDALHKAADDDATRLAEEVEKLREDLAESKRPFSAQMEMQNRRIIAQTLELERLKDGIEDICEQRATSPITRARLRHLEAGVDWRKVK